MATNLKPQNGGGLLETNNPNRDGTGSIVDLITGSSPLGTLINSISFNAITPTGECMICIYVKDASVYRLIRQVIVPLTAVDIHTPCWGTTIYLNDVVLQPDAVLAASIEFQDEEKISVSVFGYQIDSFSTCPS